MNSTELKKTIMADPLHLSSEQLAQIAADQELNEVYEQSLALNEHILNATDLPVSPALEKRLLDIPACNDASKANVFLLKPPQWFALAASLVLMLALSWFWVPSDLETFVVAHIHHEPESLMVDHNVSESDQVSLFSEYGYDLKQSLGNVTFFERCPMINRSGIHMVVETPTGRVTVLFMPGEQVDDMVRIQSNGLEGYAINLKNAAIAIVGQPGQQLQSVENQLRKAIL